MNKESKTMLEVWEAKERVSAQLLKMSPDERKAWIIQRNKKTVERLKGTKEKARH